MEAVKFELGLIFNRRLVASQVNAQPAVQTFVPDATPFVTVCNEIFAELVTDPAPVIAMLPESPLENSTNKLPLVGKSCAPAVGILPTTAGGVLLLEAEKEPVRKVEEATLSNLFPAISKVEVLMLNEYQVLVVNAE